MFRNSNIIRINALHRSNGYFFFSEHTLETIFVTNFDLICCPFRFCIPDIFNFRCLF